MSAGTAAAAGRGADDDADWHRRLGTGSYWALDKEDWKTVLRSTAKEFKNDEVKNLAAVVTLRIVLAIVPSLIAAVAIAAQVLSTEDISSLVSAAGGLIPGSAKDFVNDSLRTALDSLKDDGRFALPISIGVGLFTASGAAAAMVAALNRAYDVDEGRGFIGQRVASFGVIGAMGLALIGMFVAIVLGPTLIELLVPAEIYNSPLRFLITIGRYLAAVVILMLFFSFTFWFGPHRDRPPLRFMTPGAVFGVAMWLLLSFLFGLYVSISGSYAATYGVFAGVIVMLVWLQYSFTVLLMAAELDHEIELHIRQQNEDGEVAGGMEGDRDATTDDSADEDLDAVRDDMPRHSALMRSAAPGSPYASGQTPQRGTSLTPESTPPPPILVGAAKDTPGARLASVLWRRITRSR